MGHGVALLLQLLLLAIGELGVAELVELELQEVGILPVALNLLTCPLQTGGHVVIFSIEALIAGQLAVVGGEYVGDAHLEVLLVEQQVLVLRVYVDEFLAQLLEQCQGRGGVVDEGSALAGGGELAAHDAVIGVVLDVVVAEEGLQLVAREVEVGLDDALVGSLLERLGVGSLAQQQPDGSQDDALARSRLAGDDGESWMQLDVEDVDKRKILDV